MMVRTADEVRKIAASNLRLIQMKDLIIMPTFNKSEDDDEALEIVKENFKDHTILAIDCNEIAAEGGVLNCISWNILN